MATSFVLKSSVKLGIVGGSIYYTIDRGFWGDAEETIKAHHDLKKQLQKVPFEIKYLEIPYLDKIKLDKFKENETFTEYWNWGVKSFFCGLNCFPRVVAKYSEAGWQKLVENLK